MTLEGELVLIRDGDAADRGLETQLRALGASVCVIEFGADVFEQLARRRAALVVLDVPAGGDALLDLTPEIASRFAQTAPAVLAVVDAADGALIDRAFAQGAKDVLGRPVSLPMLRAKVQRNARRMERPAHQIGGYAVERVLGRGGMGTVYLAERDGQRYALKVLDVGAHADVESLARFRREMETLRSLRGPGIPRFFEAGRTGDAFFYVMEYVEGDTLAQVLARAPLEDAALRSLVAEIGGALSVIHGAGLVHRDVKPANIIMTRAGRATLIDYGLAKFAGDLSLTRHDEVLGTILYMAPEVLHGEDAGPASDAFALGMTALHAALGFDPLDGTAAHIARRIMQGDLPRPSERLRGISSELAAVMDGLLEKDPTRRMKLAAARQELLPDRGEAPLPPDEEPRELGIERSLVLSLEFLDGESEGRKLEFRPPRRIVIGRSKDADLEVFDAKVSRRHCSITLEAHGANVKDLGSANGTFLNGAPVKLAELSDGDRLRVADTHIRIELTDRSRTAPMTAEALEKRAQPEGELHVPGYELVARVGAGASASVFEAKSKKTGETFAIKITRPLVTPTVEDRKRFLREAATASALVHPNIVRIFERGEFAGTFFLVMEYVRGETLQAHIARAGPLPVSLALHVTRQIASALELARTCGIVHRDVKPENILIQEDGTAKLADFGLAKATLGAGQSGLTNAGEVLGTLSYMAPEQVRASATVDHRADIYALGATLYHMLTGKPPFAGSATTTAFLARIFDEEPASVSGARKDVPPVVAHLVARCLKKKPDERPRAAGDLVRQTSQLLGSVEGRDTVSDV